MRILILGLGFIGSHLVKRFSFFKHEIFLFSKRKTEINCVGGVFHGSICDELHIQKIVETVQPEIVYHLASEKARNQTVEGIYPALDVNLMGTYYLLKACSKVKSLKAVIVMGTSEEYGDNPVTPFQETWREQPITAYSLSKTCQTHLCEMMWRTFNLPVILLRPSLVYGPGQSEDMFLPALIQKLLNNEAFEMTAGKQKRDFIYIDDVVDVLVKLIDSPQAIGEIINVASGTSIKLASLANMVAFKLGKLHHLHLGKIPYRKNEIFEYNVCIDKAKILLGWEPKIGLEEGLELTLKSFREDRR